MNRDEIISMAREAASIELNVTAAFGDFLERFAELVAIYTLATDRNKPQMVDVRLLEKEYAARIAAQTEVAELKERIARSGIDQRRAVLAERKACRTECQNLADILREHNDISGAELAESLAEAIAARGAA